MNFTGAHFCLPIEKFILFWLVLANGILGFMKQMFIPAAGQYLNK